MGDLVTLRTRDGLSYKMPANNVTKGAMDSVFGGECLVIECNGIALAPASNGVFLGALPGHTYTVYQKVKDEGHNKQTRFSRIGKKMVGKRHVATRDEVRKVFVHYDRDGSGEIDIAEFRALVASLGMLIPAEEVENTFKSIDLDNNNKIEFEEFFQWFHMAKEHKNNPIRNKMRKVGQKAGVISITDPEVIRRAFMTVDADGSGEIDPDEFWQCCRNMKLKVNQEEAKRLFDAIDLDGNGTLDYSEFMTWWRSMTRGDGKKSLLAHNIRHSLYEHASTELAAIHVIHEDEEEEALEYREGRWTLLGELGKDWILPSAESKISQLAWFKKDGVVMMRGCVIDKGGASETIATLPEGARPSAIERFQCMSTSVKDGTAVKCISTTVIINPDGTINVPTPHEGELWFSGVTFTIA